VSALGAQLSAAAAVCRRDFALFATYRVRFVTTFFTAAVTLTLFYYISRLVHSSRVGSPNHYYAFVVVGVIILEVITSTLVTPVATLRSELLAGTFERMVLSPFGAVRCVLSLMIFPLLLSLALAAASVVYAGVLFGLPLRWPTLPAGVAVAFLAAVAFAPFGVLMASAVVMFKQTNAGATFVVTGLTLLAGVYFPVALLPGWIRWASDVQPFTPAADLLRNLLVGTPLREPALLSVSKLLGFAAVMLPASVAVLGAAVRHGRRRGTIIEY
jgi:ABC-2 type transport system permease protein